MECLAACQQGMCSAKKVRAVRGCPLGPTLCFFRSLSSAHRHGQVDTFAARPCSHGVGHQPQPGVHRPCPAPMVLSLHTTRITHVPLAAPWKLYTILRNESEVLVWCHLACLGPDSGSCGLQPCTVRNAERRQKRAV